MATAFMLPLSTSGQAIAVSVLVVLALLTLDGARLAVTLRKPAAWLPIALFALILAGATWSTQPLPVAIKSGSGYVKLLLIPLLMATAFTPRQMLQIGFSFLVACTILLALSWLSLLWPTGPWGWFKGPGVPVKDNAVQSSCFALCAFGLAIGALRIWASGERRRAIVMVGLALLFFADIFLIFISKTGALMAAALLLLLLLQLGGWRRAAMVVVPLLIVVGLALWSSAPAQRRLAEISIDINASQSLEPDAHETLSTAARIDFWTKGVEFLKQAPLLGNGTGSIRSMYQSLQEEQPSPYGKATSDPHNQFLHVALQVGLIGGALLLAMWAAHVWMFAQRGLVSMMGLAVVLQNLIGSLFNSHLSTVTLGMLYCLAVGLLGSARVGIRPAQPVREPIAASADA
ncbi:MULTISPECIES: O-antigen ligase family protein [Rhodopseudomonas]|nr:MULTISPECIES: O-antigen ligase family protein [Rhodopseudomonas]MDF3813537.1 O-antigen ligase family protein [Rhodopseudomonas sp. BAL398]WOK15384.1 O-antigen ligase family protein [Rhodopseudomonas sp. BAL398]